MQFPTREMKFLSPCLHVLVEVVVEDEAVGDREAMRLHGVALTVVKVADTGVEEVHDVVAPRRAGHRHRGDD